MEAYSGEQTHSSENCCIGLVPERKKQVYEHTTGVRPILDWIEHESKRGTSVFRVFVGNSVGELD